MEDTYKAGYDKIYEMQLIILTSTKEKKMLLEFRTTVLLFFIVLLLASSSNEHEGYHYEEIVNMYPHFYASRTTIHTILNEGVENNFFIKSLNSQDHRKQNYKLSADQKTEMLNWLDNNPLLNYN